ncbi:MAG: choloylglycine hydrolase family protein [Proteobacteria bacterium]|nr:choloylglycine hydrolase family protein [Pseudomonadota bacterium]
MKQNKTRNLKTWLAVLSVLAVMAMGFTLGQKAVACTGIRLIAEDESPVFGRTMEFGADMLEFNLIVVPRRTPFRGVTDTGENGMAWNGKYGFVAAIPYDIMAATEGVNEKGLQAGMFFFQPFDRAKYMAPDPAQYKNTIASWQLLTWVLSQAATVEDVKKLLPDVRVVDAVPIPKKEGWDFEPKIHYAINDASGASIVVEYLDGELHIFDNPLGTITNAPDFPWHQENLKQYTNLSVDVIPPVKRSEAEAGPTGLDIGTKANLPGVITSPNRFVRAALFSLYALPMKDSKEGVQRVLNILNNFDIPLGYKQYRHADGKVYPQYTQWTSVTDMRNRRLYFRTFSDPRLKVVDLNDFNLDAASITKIKVGDKWEVDEIKPVK